MTETWLKKLLLKPISWPKSSILSFTQLQTQWLTVLRGFYCTEVFLHHCFQWLLKLKPSAFFPFSCYVKHFWNTMQKRNVILNCGPVLCCALIFKPLCSAACFSPVKWQSVDALKAWLCFFLNHKQLEKLSQLFWIMFKFRNALKGSYIQPY